MNLILVFLHYILNTFIFKDYECKKHNDKP